MLDVSQRDRDLLRLGYPPEDIQLLNVITIGQSVWEDFVVEHYLAQGGYIEDGYSQMKIILGRPGAGKTHLLRRLIARARHLGYLSVLLRASELRLQHIDALYAAVASHVEMEDLAHRLASRVVAEVGYDLEDVPTSTTFLTWVVHEHNRIDSLVKREIAEVLGAFFKHERIDPNFSLAFTQLASDILGTHPLAGEDRQLVLRWLRAHRLRAEELHRIHLARPIDRLNARDMLHALADFVRQQGYGGLFVVIDEMEDLPCGRDPQRNRLKYGSVALADAYQSLREMVDNLPSVAGLFIVLAGQPDFLELPRGIKSYDALWLRIQHEVISPWFNRFAQVVDLDRAVQANLAPEQVRELSQRLEGLGFRTCLPDDGTVQEILMSAGGAGLYRRLMTALLRDEGRRG